MRLIEQVWFKAPQVNKLKALFITLLLLPLSGLFWFISFLRRNGYQWGLFKQIPFNIPVIVVGNISVGGNGKTPVVLWLIEQCLHLGFNVGVISRGYGGKAQHYPLLIEKTTNTAEAGDEPVMIYQRTGVKIAVGSDRIASVKKLIQQGCNLIISDDGLQHYRLGRTIELAIVDGKRGFGNALLMPAGPLREGLWRLKTVDHIIVNGSISEANNLTVNLNAKLNKKLCAKINPIQMRLKASHLVNMVSNEQVSLEIFLQTHRKINAIAGIGAPQRFFDTLTVNQFNIKKQQIFIDHYAYSIQDFVGFTTELPLLMTEKDAVKCQSFAKKHWWYLAVNAEFEHEDIAPLLTQISTLKIPTTELKTQK